ncbi:MAG: ABC transporter permease [Bacilli bacterium]
MDTFISWIFKAVVFGTIILYASLGEAMTEKAGHLNLGVPGIMYLSASSSFYVCLLYVNSTSSPNAFLLVMIALITAIIVGGLLGLLYSVMCVTFKCNQNVMGLLLTTFGVGFGKFLSTTLKIGDITASFAHQVFTTPIPYLSSIPYVGKLLFGYGFMTIAGVILAVVLHIFYNKTRIGLNLKAVGENPATADANGIDVTRYRYLATIFGCSLAGIAGITYTYTFASGLWSTNNNIESIGWLAVALVIFSTWRSIHLLWGSCLFGLLYWAWNFLPTILNITPFTGLTELLQIIPYFVTILVLVINSIRHKKENQPPESLGVPYFREKR